MIYIIEWLDYNVRKIDLQIIKKNCWECYCHKKIHFGINHPNFQICVKIPK